jgi:DNA-binding MarR family transcriptional regulator
MPARMATSRSTRKKPPAPAPAPSAARVLRRFRLVFNAVKGHFRNVEKRAGISGAQVWTLSVVRDQPGIGVSELARAMDVHQSTASNLLRGLVEKELVVAERLEADRRAVRLRITAQGQKALGKAPRPFTGVLPDALNRLDAATLARLDRDLATLIEELGVDERGAKIPLGSGEE